VRRIGAEERRARLGARHLLARPARSVEAAAAAMVALHSSDPASVYLSAWARVRAFAPPAPARAMYERRSLVRMLGMRRTMFVVPIETAAVMDEACTKPLAPTERRRLVTMLEDQGIAEPGSGAAWVSRVCGRTYEALEARGEATARELTRDVPELAHKLTFGEGRRWAGSMGVSTRILFLLATEGRIVRTRPLGGWTSGQYRWAPTASWLGRSLPVFDRGEARARLLAMWLRGFGPATLTDVRWWTGWTSTAARAALEAIAAAEVELDVGVGYVLSDDARPAARVRPWAALLPGLDATVMGWKERSWYLGDHAPRVFDRNGNAGPTVWVDGRVVGGWAQTAHGDIDVELLEAVGADARRRIEAERARLREWLGDVRIKTRFPSPLERTLAGR
jgi:Winged helix DNA-binding domain